MGTNVFGYAYDPIGNRLVSTNNATATTYAANTLNQYTNIINIASITPMYDDDGNLTTNGVWIYTWDGENRLIGVSSNGVDVAAYAYDFASRRVMKTAQGVTRGYLYDGWNLIRESAGTNVTHYIWGLDLSGSIQGAGGVGGLLAVISPLPLGEGQGVGNAVYYPSFDANGNLSAYSSTDGTLVAHYEYSPFGETIGRSGELANTFTFRFSTKYWEDDIELYYYGFRFYSPDIGRWLNRDPIQEKGGVNLFSFVSNNSFTSVDYLGMWNIPYLAPISAVATGVKLLLSLDELFGRAMNTYTSVYDVKCSSDCRRKLLFESEKREEEILEFIVAAASANFANSFTTVKTFGRYKVQKYGCCCKVWGADTTRWTYKPDVTVSTGIGQWSLFDAFGVPVGTIKYYNKDTEMEKSRECKISCKPTFEGWVI
jgi:RHS repeat-associated protein